MMKLFKRRIKKLWEAIALLSVEIIMVMVGFFVALSLLVWIIEEIFYDKENDFDERVFSYLSHHISHSHTDIMQAFTFLGSQYFLVPAWLLVFAYYIFVKKDKWNFIKTAVVASSNLLLMFGLKFLFNRQRPLIPLLKEAHGLSFPSGHAFMSLTFFGFVIYKAYTSITNGWLKWSAVILLTFTVMMIGLSRIYLRVHFTSDVLAGYCFAVVSVTLLLWMLREVEKYNAKKVPYHLNVTKNEEDPVLKKVS
jgi:membrane-associated phospholipid phosphatase